MRNLSPGMADHLASGTTTLCFCWRLTRKDGVVAGFTDHDRDLNFVETTFVAETGLEAAQAESRLGLAVGGSEVSGILTSSSLLEDDLANGLYDAAQIEMWRVNWNDPAERILLDVFTIGEIRRTPGAFHAELRGMAHLLDQERGRIFQFSCDADLGDGRCTVNTADPQFQIDAAIVQPISQLQLVIDSTGYEKDWFSGGKIEFLDGSNSGSWQTVKQYLPSLASAKVLLWNPVALPVLAGDTIRLTAGCDKTFATCRTKFANIANFRGFPHMPGGDALMAHPGSSDGPLDGGSLYN